MKRAAFGSFQRHQINISITDGFVMYQGLIANPFTVVFGSNKKKINPGIGITPFITAQSNTYVLANTPTLHFQTYNQRQTNFQHEQHFLSSSHSLSRLRHNNVVPWKSTLKSCLTNVMVFLNGEIACADCCLLCRVGKFTVHKRGS